MQHPRRLFIRLSLGQQLQHLAFAHGQQLIAVAHAAFPDLPHEILRQHLADHRTEECLPVVNRANGRDQIRLRRVLQQISPRPRLQRPHDIAFVRVHAQHHHRNRRILRRDLLRGVQPVQPGHGHVHHGDIGGQFAGLLHGLVAVGRLAHHLKVLLPLQQHAQPAAHHRVVVGQQNPDFPHTGSGNLTMISVPRPGSDSTFKAPPRFAIRSCIPSKPMPRAASASKPTPSS